MIEAQLNKKLQDGFQPLHVELFNESGMHAGPATDSHFKLVMVSEIFNGLSRVKRHQAVYRVLAEELAGPVHALALHLMSPNEWQSGSVRVNDSPECSNK